MTIIYLHGLDADPNANKAIITANHAKALGIDTLRPDLNCPPDEVVAKLLNLIKETPMPCWSVRLWAGTLPRCYPT